MAIPSYCVELIRRRDLQPLNTFARVSFKKSRTSGVPTLRLSTDDQHVLAAGGFKQPSHWWALWTC
eukprot:3354820-Amphidinium_carterae.2